jgi:5-methyltetrahydropteroyltriglutamate--homocysteine methyltransferase
MTHSALLAQLVGSYSKPGWLVNHSRVTTPYDDAGFWRPEPSVLRAAQDDATRLAIDDQERVGLDVITDGEERRHRFDSYFFRRFGGLDTVTLGAWRTENRDMSFIDVDPEVRARLDQARAPRVVSEITWPGPIALQDLRFLKRHTRRPVKMTVIGPLTTAARLVNEFYTDEESLGLAAASVINEELRSLDALGVDIIQLDEPDFHFRHDAASRWGTRALDRAFLGIRATTAVHICYGYAYIGRKRAAAHYGSALEAIAASTCQQISLEYEQPKHDQEILRCCGDKTVILGCLDLGTSEVENPSYIAGRIRAALTVVPPERLHVAPDCGMWFLPRPVAFAKLESLVAAASMVRKELGGDMAARTEDETART